MSNLDAKLSELSDVGGFLGTCLVDHESGMVLAAIGGSESFDLDAAAAGGTEIMRSTNMAMRLMGGREQCEDILVSWPSQHHLIRVVPKDNGLFLLLALRTEVSNLALARRRLLLTADSVQI